MYSAGAGAGAGASAAAAIAQAIKASGVLVRVAPEEFMSLLGRMESPLVVTSESRFFGTTYKYLTSYKGLAFYAKSSRPLPLPPTAECVISGKIWIPG
ncbi:MAG: hypothetical protein P8Z49_10160 [Acidobacteriota bacterium]